MSPNTCRSDCHGGKTASPRYRHRGSKWVWGDWWFQQICGSLALLEMCLWNKWSVSCYKYTGSNTSLCLVSWKDDWHYPCFQDTEVLQENEMAQVKHQRRGRVGVKTKIICVPGNGLQLGYFSFPICMFPSLSSKPIPLNIKKAPLYASS